jgi:hypothetical protein
MRLKMRPKNETKKSVQSNKKVLNVTDDRSEKTEAKN